MRRASIVWAVLVVATIASWRVGLDQKSWASTLVIVIAMFKVRLVGLNFMELRTAPAVLRGLFEGWVAVVGTALVVLFLAA